MVEYSNPAPLTTVSIRSPGTGNDPLGASEPFYWFPGEGERIGPDDNGDIIVRLLQTDQSKYTRGRYSSTTSQNNSFVAAGVLYAVQKSQLLRSKTVNTGCYRSAPLTKRTRQSSNFLTFFTQVRKLVANHCDSKNKRVRIWIGNRVELFTNMHKV